MFIPKIPFLWQPGCLFIFMISDDPEHIEILSSAVIGFGEIFKIIN